MKENWKFDKSWLKIFRSFIILATFQSFKVDKTFPNNEQFTPNIGMVKNTIETCRYVIKNLKEQDTIVVLFEKNFPRSSRALFSAVILSTNLPNVDSSAFLFNNRGDIVNFYAKNKLNVYDTAVINSKENLNTLLIKRRGKHILNKSNWIMGPIIHKPCEVQPIPDISSPSINQLNNGWRYQAIIQYRRDRVLGKPALFPFWAYWVEILCVIAFFIVWPPKMLWSNMRKALK